MVTFNTPQNTPKTYFPPIKKVRKLADGSVFFPYIKEVAPWKFVHYTFNIKREGNYVYIENTTKLTSENKQYVKNKQKKIELGSTSEKVFLISLGSALSEYVGRGRRSATKKGEETYRLLGY